MSYFQSKMLLAAKAIAAKDWSNPRVLGAIRKAAHNGASIEEIRTAFWPDITWMGTYNRLKKFNIKARPINNRARCGYETSLSNHNRQIGTESFKARVKAEASSL